MKLIFKHFAHTLLCITLVGCAIPIKESETTKPPPVRAVIQLKHMDKNTWQVEYTFSEPLKTFTFLRQTTRFRRELFKPLDPGVVVTETKQQNEEFVSSEQPRTNFRFSLQSYFATTPKDYEFFRSYTDGSVLVYTGHFNPCLLENDNDCDRIQPRFDFYSLKGERILVDNHVFEEKALAITLHERGTYVYFGKLKPLETPYLTALIDPQLPKWVKKDFEKTLKNLFQLYTERLKEPLPFKPFIFFSYMPKAEDFGSGGGTLPGLVQMTLDGNWSRYDRESYLRIMKLLAHESAHIWNGQIYKYPGQDIWMHEGAADAFAFSALEELGVYTAAERDEAWTTSLNTCLLMLKGRSVRAVRPPEDPEYRAHYACGAVAHLIIMAALKNKGHTLWSFWSEVFKNAPGKEYSELVFYKSLDKLTENTELSNFINQLMNGPIFSPEEKILAQLAKHNINISSEKNVPAQISLHYSRELLRELMRKDCGFISITREKSSFVLNGKSECQTFRNQVRIKSVAGFNLMTDGYKATDAVYEICKSNGVLTTQIEGQQVELTCPDAIARPHKYIRLKL